MSALNLRLPESLHVQVRELAQRDQVSIARVLVTANAPGNASPLHSYQRQPERHPCAFRLAPDHIWAAAQRLGPLLHPQDAERLPPTRCTVERLVRQPDAIVVDGHHQAGCGPLHLDVHLARAGMADHVGDRFLRDAKGRGGDFGWQSRSIAIGIQFRAQYRPAPGVDLAPPARQGSNRSHPAPAAANQRSDDATVRWSPRLTCWPWPGDRRPHPGRTAWPADTASG